MLLGWRSIEPRDPIQHPTVTKRVGLIIDGVKYFTAASNVVLA